MGEFYLVRTYFGDRVLPKGTEIGVQLKDGSFQPVPVEDAKRFAGKSSTIFEKRFINILAEELEARLMQVEEGPFSYYKKTKLSLHEREGEQYTPKLSAILKRTHQQSGKTLDDFLQETHELLQQNANQQQFETVKPDTLKEWYQGTQGTVAPEEWKNFAGLMKLAENYSAAKEFSKFYQDYQEYMQNPEANRFLENIHYAYKYYRIQKSKFGMKTSNKISKSQKKKRNYAQKRVIAEEHDQAIEDFIMQNFYKDINSNHVATALLEVIKLQNNGAPQKEQGVEGDGTSRKGVYIVKDKRFDIDVPTKTQAQIAKDVIILERTFLNRIFYYIFETRPDKRINEQIYINCTIEERIRKNPMSKQFLGLEQQEIREAEKTASQIYKEIFESQTANKFFSMKQDSFQNMRDAYNSVIYFFPQIIETFLNAMDNVEKMQQAQPPTKPAALAQWKKRKIELQQIIDRTMWQADEKHHELGIQGLLTERVHGAVAMLANKMLTKQFLIDELRIIYTKDLIAAGKRITDMLGRPTAYMEDNMVIFNSTRGDNLTRIYQKEEIIETLTRYGLEEFAIADPEIECQKILYS